MLLVALSSSESLCHRIDAGDTRSLDLHGIGIEGTSCQREDIAPTLRASCSDFTIASCVIEAEILYEVLESSEET